LKLWVGFAKNHARQHILVNCYQPRFITLIYSNKLRLIKTDSK